MLGPNGPAVCRALPEGQGCFGDRRQRANGPGVCRENGWQTVEPLALADSELMVTQPDWLGYAKDGSVGPTLQLQKIPAVVLVWVGFSGLMCELVALRQISRWVKSDGGDWQKDAGRCPYDTDEHRKAVNQSYKAMLKAYKFNIRAYKYFTKKRHAVIIRCIHKIKAPHS